MWAVYLISTGTRTYIGSTTDVSRRIRQHNGEIRGGARSTKPYAGKWEIVIYISGFENRSSACRWERIIKCRARGLENRKQALYDLITGICPRGPREYEVPSGLTATIMSRKDYKNNGRIQEIQ